MAEKHQAAPEDADAGRAWPIDTCILTQVSQAIGRDLKPLGREMGFTEANLDAIEYDHGRWGLKEVAFKTLDTWREEQGKAATLSSLAEHLCRIGREDIAKDIAPLSTKGVAHYPTRPTQKSQSTSKPGRFSWLVAVRHKQKLNNVLKQVKTRLCDQYKWIQLKGLPWMENIKISLADYYVDLSMTEQDDNGIDLPERNIQLDEIFASFGLEKKPRRVLIEGGPGYGKTTLGCKLCFDSATKRTYIHHFDLVLLLPLRDFEGDLNELLIRATGVVGEDADNLFAVLNKKNRKVLLILEGFDELPKHSLQHILPILKGEVFPHFDVIVTSRPGLFSSDSEIVRQNSLLISHDISIDVKIFNRRIKITGFNEAMQKEFIHKHLSRFPLERKISVQNQLSCMIRNNMLSSSVLQCPLFLLMIITLITETDRATLKQFKTKTAIYKQVTNFVIHRYLTKIGNGDAQSIDLYSLDFVNRPLYIELMMQFGQFSIEALNSGKLFFTLDEILGTEGSRHSGIADLGLLMKNTYMEGFREKVYYEPVHKTLMEFAAAYYMWMEYVTGPRHHWEKHVCSIRPKVNTASSSVIFPFLAGLMEHEAADLFHALKPFAVEYSTWFGLLGSSFEEVQMTSSVVSSLLPLLPVQWHVPLCRTNSLSCSLSDQREVLIDRGLKEGRIWHIYWLTLYPARFPEEVKVDKLTLNITQTLCALGRSKYKRFRCRELHCVFSITDPSPNDWSVFLSLLASIDFQLISFHLRNSCSFFLPLLQEALSMGSLRDRSTHWIDCRLAEDESSLMPIISDIITQTKLVGLWIDLLPSSSVLSFSIHTEQPNSLLQRNLDELVMCISSSNHLTRFVLIDHEEPRLAVDLAKLFSPTPKMFDAIRLTNIEVNTYYSVYFAAIQHTALQIHHLKITNSCLTDSISDFLPAFHVTSLACNYPLLAHAVESCLLHEHLTELCVIIDESIFHKDFFSRLSRLLKLQTLSLQITSFDFHSFSLPVKEWFLGAQNYSLSLRELEIWAIEENCVLASELVNAIIDFLEKPLSDPFLAQANPLSFSMASGPNLLQLTNLTLKTNTTLEPRNMTLADSATVTHVFCLAAAMKSSLKNGSLPHLIVVEWVDNLLRYLPMLKPQGFISLIDMFPSDEGFIVESDYLGMKGDDSIWNKQFSEYNPDGYIRFTVSLSENKKS